MIVDPDFLDHWKTRTLVGLLGEEAAPVYVLRLWAHCQLRRQSMFDNLSAEALKALCRFSGPANKLETSLTASGFIRRNPDGVMLVCGWDEYNSSLIAAWKNGKRGGRPPQNGPEKPSDNPRVYPGDNPRVSPRVSEESRGEGIGEEKKQDEPPTTTRAVFARPSVADIEGYCRERGNRVDAAKFFDFYEAKGWKIGKNAMKDWKAAVRTWEGNERERGGSRGTGGTRPASAVYDANRVDPNEPGIGPPPAPEGGDGAAGLPDGECPY